MSARISPRTTRIKAFPCLADPSLVGPIIPRKSERFYTVWADSRRTPQWQLANPALWQSLVDEGMAALQPGADDPALRVSRLRQLAARRQHDTWARLPGLRMPVSVFAGRYDALATPEVQLRLASRIAGAGYHEYAGGHPFFVEDRGAAAMIADTLGGDVPFTPGS